jgi:protein-S-isoprenylcysteine O-methyltransferase Ste14
MPVISAVVFALWSAFWLYWFVASIGVKRPRSTSPRFLGGRVVVILLVLLALRTNLLRTNGVIDNPLVVGIGLVLFVLGLLLAVWARVYLGRNWGTPMSEKVDAELVSTGPYRYVRHPIYSGLILAMTGSALAVNVYWLAAVLVLGAYFVYSAKVEERIMVRLFPNTYPVYKRSTKMLIPFIL